MLLESLLSIAVSAFPLIFKGEIPNAKAETKLQAPAAETLELHAVEHLIIQHTNAERRRYGLPSLAVDQHLVKSARAHAIWMTTRQTLTHTNQPVAENIAFGQESAAEAVRSWMNSPGHRANILSAGHRRIGVAAFVARNGRIYWCQQFLK
ncbi:MAG TPA: CAP domain-containing protein [Pirellulales bacterium]|nr:CAP domain-containing protein [Pirellulales bacterium]